MKARHPSRRVVVRAALSLAATAAFLGQVPAQAQRSGDPAAETIAAGRILVMPRAGIPEHALERILKEQGGLRGRRVGQTELRIVDVPPGQERQTVERLARHPHVKFAEADRLSRPSSTNDPLLGSQWHLTRIGAPAAWAYSQGSGVTIAILDTGVEASHPDLAARLVPGWNFFNNTADTSDAYDHGTGVAGAAAAAMNNGVGVASVAGQARIMPIRISDASGWGSWSAMAQGLTYAADRGVRVANISFASAYTSSSVLSAAQYMKNKGGLVFISAGNTGAATTTSPTTSAIVVSATDSADARAGWSTYGSAVSLAAPGVSVYTTANGGRYVPDNGTSFASPVAAGVAALVMAANPSLTAAQVENLLFSTAVDLGAAGRDAHFGHGRVDAAAAVLAALGTSGGPAPDVQPPSAAIAAPLANSTVSGLVPVSVNVSDNVGVTRVELRVNNRVVSTDTAQPFGFSWDATTVANGMHTLSIVAYDAAGNAGTSTGVAVNVANNAVVDTTPPVVAIGNPADGATVSGNVQIRVSASDDGGSAGLSHTLLINGMRVATSTGTSLNHGWNTRKSAAGLYTIRAEVRDAAGNVGHSTVTVRVTR